MTIAHHQRKSPNENNHNEDIIYILPHYHKIVILQRWSTYEPILKH